MSGRPPNSFDHERLEVYQLGRELNREIASILAELPRAAADAADNLRRAGGSIVRNIGEAGGKWTPKDKAHYYHIARGSGTEVAASLHEIEDFGFVTAARADRVRTLAWRIVSMLTGLIRSLGRPIHTPRPTNAGR